ncbi:MAG: hypothetical protein ACPLW8_06185, partial [Candidatus Bathyarchaeales archaeon]
MLSQAFYPSLATIAESNNVLLYDDFSSDTSLNKNIWVIDEARILATSSPGFTFVSPTLSFSSSGMAVSGPNNYMQVTGVSSVQSFSPPFTFTAMFRSSGTSCSQPNSLYILGPNEHLEIVFVPNPDNSPSYAPQDEKYYGVWVTHTGGPSGYSSTPDNLLYASPHDNTWYTYVVSIDANGYATVALLSESGAVLGGKSNLYVGKGPFYICLVQRIGQPWVTPAPMTGIWKYAKVVGSVANIQLPPVKKYSVTFKESGLPLGTMWSVTLAGSKVFSLGKTITFLLQNGTYPFTIEPVSGYAPSPSSGNVNVSGKDVTVEITFSPPAPSFDFSISTSGTEVKVVQGGTTTVPISVQLTSGNPSNVSLSVGWIPEGSYQWFTTEFNPSSGNPPFSSTLTIKVKDSAPIGKYIAQIFATGGGKAKSVTVTVDIYPPTLIVKDY